MAKRNTSSKATDKDTGSKAEHTEEPAAKDTTSKAAEPEQPDAGPTYDWVALDSAVADLRTAVKKHQADPKHITDALNALRAFTLAVEEKALEEQLQSLRNRRKLAASAVGMFHQQPAPVPTAKPKAAKPSTSGGTESTGKGGRKGGAEWHAPAFAAWRSAPNHTISPAEIVKAAAAAGHEIAPASANQFCQSRGVPTGERGKYLLKDEHRTEAADEPTLFGGDGKTA